MVNYYIVERHVSSLTTNSVQSEIYMNLIDLGEFNGRRLLR